MTTALTLIRAAPPRDTGSWFAWKAAVATDSVVDLLMPARVLHEQGDLDAVVNVELVEQAGDVGLDRRDGEVQSCSDLRVRLAAADGERDVVLAWAERGHAVAGVGGA